MKSMHLNKIMAIAQVKTKAFMGKNCIIMPIFAVGFTIIMRFVYGYIAQDAAGSEHFLNAMALSMGVVMNIGMCGIYCPSLLLAEEKEKKTLRVLMTSSVSGMEFFFGSLLPIFLVTSIINFVLIPLSGCSVTGSNLAIFGLVTILATLTSCILGMLLGIFAKNQVSASTLTTPFLLILMLVPMFSSIVESLKSLSMFIFTGVVQDMITNIVIGADKVVDITSIIIMIVEVVLSALLFVYFYKKNGFEAD